MTADELHYESSTLIGAAEDIREETDHYWNQLNSLILAVEKNDAVWKGSGADFFGTMWTEFHEAAVTLVHSVSELADKVTDSIAVLSASRDASAENIDAHFTDVEELGNGHLQF